MHPDDVNRTPKGVLDACVEKAIMVLEGAGAKTGCLSQVVPYVTLELLYLLRELVVARAQKGDVRLEGRIQVHACPHTRAHAD